MALKAGDWVKFIDDVGMAEIIRIQGDQALLLNEDGFEQWAPLADLVKSEGMFVDEVIPKDEFQKPTSTKRAFKERGIMEKDLHIHNLVHDARRMSNYEMLQLQLDAAEKAISKARRSNSPKLILIHGVGEGKLRSALHSMLKAMDGVSFYDASFLKYGAGATEIDLW